MLGIIVGRAMQGFGSGQLIVALYVIVGRAYPAELRPKMFAAFAARGFCLPSSVRCWRGSSFNTSAGVGCS